MTPATISRRLLSFILMLPLIAGGQELPAKWADVQNIAAGAKVHVKRTDHRTVKGNLIRVSETGIDLSVKDAPHTVARKDISRVYRVVSRKRLRAVGIGAAIGAGLGAGIGGYAYSGGDFETGVISGMAIIGAGAGALVGLLFGSRSTLQLVYAAYPPPDRH
jgi:hypothetical protein